MRSWTDGREQEDVGGVVDDARRGGRAQGNGSGAYMGWCGKGVKNMVVSRDC